MDELGADLLSNLEEAVISQQLDASRDCPVESPFPPGFFKNSCRPAAVLIPLLKVGGSWNVLFIRRTTNQNDPHSGQVAFPGGAADQGETNAQETALREAFEEIGLKPEDVHILGQMHAFDTITGYRVTPVVGVISWPYPLCLEQKEVSRAFTVPLSWLADLNNREDRARFLPAPFFPINVIYYREYDGETLWGASARFITRFLEILFANQSTRPC